MMIHIRKMEAKDYPSVDQLMQQLHLIHVKGRPDMYRNMEHPFSLKEFEEKVEDEECISVLAETEEKRIAGICFVQMRNKTNMIYKRTAYMDDLIVDERYQQQGIARLLFEEAEKEAKRLGAERLDLMVWGFNEKALKFYETMGMKPQRYIYEKNIK